MRVGASRFHLFREGLNLAKVFLQLDFGDERTFAALTVSHAQVAKRLEGLAGRHAADAKALGDYLFRGQRLAGLKSARANFLEEVLLDLEVERDGALSVKVKRVHSSHPSCLDNWGVFIFHEDLFCQEVSGNCSKGLEAKKLVRRKDEGGLPWCWRLCLKGNVSLHEYATLPKEILFLLVENKRFRGLPDVD